MTNDIGDYLNDPLVYYFPLVQHLKTFEYTSLKGNNDNMIKGLMEKAAFDF